MKNLVINPSHNIISRIKEVFEGFLSMFDGNKYTISDYDEIDLPDVLKKHTEQLVEKAKQYEINGVLPSIVSYISKEQQLNSKNKVEKPKAKQYNNNQINPIKKITNMQIIDNTGMDQDR